MQQDQDEPYSQYGRDPIGRDPYSQYGREPIGREPYDRDPIGQEPYSPYDRDPIGREASYISYKRRLDSTYASRLRIRALSETPTKSFYIDDNVGDLPFRPVTMSPSMMMAKDFRYNYKPFKIQKEKPDLIKFGYSARPTASGLIDPWEDLSMDRKILPKIQDKPLVSLSPYSPRRSKKKGGSTPRSSKEGSTMCPQFPVVTMPVKEWETKTLTYMDVPTMRKNLDKCFMKINNQDKTNVDYVRTKQDFYRMDLGKLDEVRRSNRHRMKMTYNAYLTNTTGSKQAIQECLKTSPRSQQVQQQQVEGQGT